MMGGGNRLDDTRPVHDVTRNRLENAVSGDVAWIPSRTSAGEIVPLNCGHEVYRHLAGKTVDQRRAVLRDIDGTFCPTCGKPAVLWVDPIDDAVGFGGQGASGENEH